MMSASQTVYIEWSDNLESNSLSQKKNTCSFSYRWKITFLKQQASFI